MEATIRDVAAGDLDEVLALNEANVPAVGSVDAGEMAWFAEMAPYFRVIEVEGRIGAFLIGLRPGLDYKSPNYRWFLQNYDDFGYVDRIAVSEHARRLGLASRLYADFEATLPASVSVMTCEVNSRPPNEVSMHFHERQGFKKVGMQETDGGDKEVALLAKQLERVD